MGWTLVPKKVTQVLQLLPEKVNYRSWESTWISSNERKIWPAPDFEDVCHELGGVMDSDIRILFFRAWKWKWLCQWCTGMNFAQCIRDASCEGLWSKLWDPTIQAIQQNLNVQSPNFSMTFRESVPHVTRELFHRLLFVVVWRVQWSNQPKARIPAAWTASFEARIHPSTPSGVKRMKIQQ